MASDPSAKPIRSLCSEDPELEERIDAFVLRLGETVDAFQDGELAGDWGRLVDLAQELEAESRELGYPALAEVARRVAAASAELSPDAARKSIVDLTELAQRVRRGHRSAA